MRIHSALPSLAALLALGLATPACNAQSGAESGDLRQQIETLQKEQKALQDEVSELKEILAPILARLPKPFRPTDLTTAGSPSMGEESAKVVLVEFSDLQCPFCVRFYQDTFPRIVEDYVKTGKARYVAREFPLSNIHPQARRASEAALCANEQDNYWAMRGKIFENRNKLSDEDLLGYAEEVGLDTLAWKACLESNQYSKKVDADMADVRRLGITGTPSFAIGLASDSDPDTFHATKLLQGAVPFQQFQEAMAEVLSEVD
jgi:protein-disulfide isomerase